MPFQLDKKKLLIGGGLLLLLVVVIIAVVVKKKSPQEHAADAQDAANMAVMHANIANAAANSPDNSAKDSTVTNALAAAKQASDQSKDSSGKAAAGGAPVTPPPTLPKNNYIMITSPSAVANNYLVFTEGQQISFTTDITKATPISSVKTEVNAEGMNESVNLIQTASGQYINIYPNPDVTSGNGHAVSFSDTSYVNSLPNKATLTINSANALQTFFQNIEYWYIAFALPTGVVFNSAASGNLAVTVVSN